MPGVNSDHADWNTEIFALGSVFYHIVENHESFPELDSYYDEEQIVKKFKSGQYPETKCSLINRVIHKCWAGDCDSADAVLQDLTLFHGRSMAGIAGEEEMYLEDR